MARTPTAATIWRRSCAGAGWGRSAAAKQKAESRKQKLKILPQRPACQRRHRRTGPNQNSPRPPSLAARPLSQPNKIMINREDQADVSEKFSVMRERLDFLRQPIVRCHSAAMNPPAANGAKPGD